METVATCSMTDGNGSCHGLVSSFLEEMTRCSHQKHHRRWPGNPNGRSKFCNIRYFTFTRSQLTLRWRLRGWRQLPESLKWHVADVKNIASIGPAMTRINQNSIITKMYAYEIKQNLSKNIFLMLGRRRCDGIVSCLFSTITRNGFCSHLQKIISRRLWPAPKNRDIHIEEFFCRFYL